MITAKWNNQALDTMTASVIPSKPRLLVVTSISYYVELHVPFDWFFLSVNTGRPHMTSSWIYRKGSVSEEIRKPLVYTITGELQNSYSLWFSEVAVAVVTCCLRWYFHAIGKENRKAACDLILYKVKGMSLTNSIRGYTEVVSCHWDRKMEKLLFSLVFIAFIFYVSSWSYVRKPTACFRS